MRTYKEQADELITLIERSKKEAIINFTTVTNQCRTLIKAGEYFINYCEKTDYQDYDEYGNDRETKISDCYPLYQELKEIQKSITRLKEVIT